MPRRKKTWVERTRVAPAEDWQLLDHLWYAVYQACRQLGWDMEVVRRTESFCKIETWLPKADGTAGISFVDVYLDVITPGKLVSVFRNYENARSFEWQAATVEARAFADRLQEEFQQLLVRWLTKHGAAERERIAYLINGSERNDSTAKASAKKVQPRSAPAKPKRSTRTHAAEAHWQLPSQSSEANLRKRGMTDERQKRAWTFKRIKDDQPAMSYAQVALAARSQGFADADEEDVKNDYRAMGWRWKRADRGR